MRNRDNVALADDRMGPHNSPPIQAYMAFFRQSFGNCPAMAKSQKPQKLVNSEPLFADLCTSAPLPVQACILFFHTLFERSQLGKGTSRSRQD